MQWYREGFAAIGWPPPGECETEDEPGFALEGPPADDNWAFKQKYLREM